MLASLPWQVLPKIYDIVNILLNEGARVYVVGGAVRDFLLNRAVHDVDIEIHGLTMPHVETLLAHFGNVHCDGKSFGVLRIDGIPIDWSLPRRDSSGRKPLVAIDPTMPIVDALRRRDLTMNAMAVDCATGQVIDPFNGQASIKNKILSVPDAAFFAQDPLRFYRVMQFIGRFDMKPDRELDDIARTMSLEGISIERIHAECDKLMLLSDRPSLGLRWIKHVGRIASLFPELGALIDVPQEPGWHPEGDVFEHTMQALDAAVQRPKVDRRLLCYAALCHDLGKATTTEKKDCRWRSFNHERAGVFPAKKLCSRMMGNKDLINQVAILVRHHMAPGQFIAQQATFRAYKRLAQQLAPQLNLYILAQLAYADKLGRNPERNGPLSGQLPAIDEFITKAQEYGVLYQAEKPLITGHDLIDLGYSGPALGKALQQAYAYQIEHDDSSRETILRYLQGVLK